MRAVLVLVALALAGCADQAPAVIAPQDAATPSQPSWREAARGFDVPAGDSFGVLVRTFAPDESLDGDGKTFGLTLDTTALGKDSYAEFSAHRIDGAEASWKAVAFLLDGTVRSVAAADPQTPTTLFVIVVHAEKPGRIRVGDWTSGGKLPEADVNGAFLASGPVELSYLLAYGHVGTDRVEERTIAHGVKTDGAGVPPGSFATAGTPSATSTHQGANATLEFAYFQSYPEYGAGVVKTSWTANGKTTAGSFAYASPADIAETVAVGPAAGPTTAALSETGAGALPQFWLHHSSVPIDLASLGLREAPRVVEGANKVPLPGGAACLRADASAACA